MLRAIQGALLTLLLIPAAAGAEEARLLRQPAIHGDTVVFVYAGDLWSVPTSGGTARRLTAFKGMELFPVISPDGSWIAFSGEYAGTRQIYVMPVEGGEPRQLSFYPDVGSMPPRGGWDNIPIDWTPDSKRVLFRSNRTPYGQRVSRYFLVDAAGGSFEEPLQIPEGGPASLSPDGGKLAYSIKSREFRTWKRYRAGRAQDVWIYDLQHDTIDRLTTYAGTDSFPMWVGETIYFVSDRAAADSDEPRTLNIFAVDLSGPEAGQIRQITHFSEYDCLWPSRGVGGIVFENGGYLYHLDTSAGATKEATRIPVMLHDDRPHAWPRYQNVAENIDSSRLSPHGKRAVFSARGEIFTVPAKHGDVVNLSRSDGLRELAVDWSPDGEYLSYLSEASGEYELFIRPYHSNEPAVQLTSRTDAWITRYRWSPDASKIVLTDTRHRLQLLDVASRTLSLLDTSRYSQIEDLSWSADSRWIAYVKSGENQLNAIWVCSVEERQPYRLSSGRDIAAAPVFSRDGQYLYFVSQRDFEMDNRRFEGVLLAGALRADLPPLLLPRNDDETDETESAAGNGTSGHDNGSGRGEGVPATVTIDVDGFESRVVAFPVASGEITRLTPLRDGLLYLRDGKLFRYQLEERQESVVLDQVDSYTMAANGTKLLYQSGSLWGIASVNGGNSVTANRLDLSGMVLRIDPATEWRQIYFDAWRIMRDWFYDPGMHGVDWEAMRDRYAVLVPHVAHRADLDYVLGELIAELNAGHTYVFPGDQPEVARVPVGTLGCELKPDGGFFRITKIYAGESWSDERRSPLAESGITVSEGNYLIAVDNELVTTADNPYRFLENKVGRSVTLRINDHASEEGSWEVQVRPVAGELQLRHLDWVERNRRIVDQLSNGRVGYIYVPDTDTDGFREFYRAWPDQSCKEALIIDDRYNGGGQIPDPMAFDLSHPVLQYWARRSLQMVSTPAFAHEGPKVMLINGRSSSGGDAFPAYFRSLSLGPLMGHTTWGGLIGYDYSPSFVDGGQLAVPSFGYVSTAGEWDVEGYGVEPDIEVFDDPTLIQAGREPMLERAVEYLLDELQQNPPREVQQPPPPDRS